MGAFCVAAALGAPVVAQTTKQPPFQFGAVDLKLLEECNAIDRQLEDRGLVYHDVAIEKRLAELGAAVTPRNNLERVEWRYRILRDPLVNAFALVNGSIYIDSGLLARAENDDQVAGVLAHEVTHVANRHGYLANRTIRRRSVALNVIGLASSMPLGGLAGAAIVLGSSISQVAISFSIYGYSRDLEREADLTAMDHLKRAGRDRAQVVRLLSIFDDKLEPEPVPIFYNDHPRTKYRITYLKKSSPSPPIPRRRQTRVTLSE